MKKLFYGQGDIIEFKSEDDGRLTITGYAAYFNNIDSYKDVILPGAFSKTIEERSGRIAFCYQHDIFSPIAKIESLSEDAKGLFVTAKISASEEDIQTKIKEGIISEMSIGYSPVKSKNGNAMGYEDARLLEEIKLFEISLVTIAANPLAVITGMKSDEQKSYLEKEFDRVIAIVRNENINFEIMKLKSLVLSIAPESQTPPKVEEPQLKALVFESNFFTNNLI